MAFDPNQYRHDLDKKTFDMLNSSPQFNKLKDAYVANVDERTIKINFLSSAIRLSEHQFPEIYKLLSPICIKLGIDIPELYYVNSNDMNAMTVGSLRPYIIITSALVKNLPLKYMSSILAHECGHISCQHYLYQSIVRELIDNFDQSSLSKIEGIKENMTSDLMNALLLWDRCSELSADRAAMLCVRNVDQYVDVLLKLHGYEKINRKEFLKQAMDLKAFVNESKSNALIEQLLIQDETHPRLATRVYECYKWVKTDQFQKLIKEEKEQSHKSQNREEK